ncbi:BICD family-like cargo adapter 1 isoform X2 [Anolis carolinensis]|uniref:BICD family like cargo adaptor 1 n=1 Tax=Anolis carolinensis TaxID=28377 RepID=H9G7T5_ANOCA
MFHLRKAPTPSIFQPSPGGSGSCSAKQGHFPAVQETRWARPSFAGSRRKETLCKSLGRCDPWAVWDRGRLSSPGAWMCGFISWEFQRTQWSGLAPALPLLRLATRIPTPQSLNSFHTPGQFLKCGGRRPWAGVPALPSRCQPRLQIKMLTDRKHELERRLSAVMEENNLLQGTVEELQDRVLILERQSHEKDVQLHQSQLELQEVRMSYRQLQLKVEELSEERSLQHFNSTSTSLLSEIEQSMEAEELEQEREQLRLQLWEAYCQVRYLCTHLRGNDSADSAVSTDSSMDESSETSSAKDVPAGSLRAALSELKRLIQSVIDGTDSPSSRRSDDDALEEQIKQTSEDSRALRELMEGERGKLRQSLEELQQLHSQVTLLSVEMTSLKEERDRLRGSGEEKEMNEQLLKAIRDRDEAIAKKNAVEMELAKCKIDMMSLNSQLLDAIQQKLNLSQQLEAWQDDMQRVIDQQLMDKHPKEWSQPTYSFSGGHGGKRRARPSPMLRPEQQGSEPIGAEGNRLFAFFKKN